MILLGTREQVGASASEAVLGARSQLPFLETCQPILPAHKPAEFIWACFKVKVGVGHLCSEKRKFPVFLRCGRSSFIQKMAWMERKNTRREKEQVSTCI